MFKNWKKTLVIYLIALVLLNIVWLIVFHKLINRDYDKTTATVISLSTNPPSGSYGSQDTTYPTYEFTDKSGQNHIYQDTDGFNQFTKYFFGEKIGDRVSLYYGHTNPGKDIIVAHGGNYWTFVLAPVFLGTFIPAVATLVAYVFRRNFRRA